MSRRVGSVRIPTEKTRRLRMITVTERAKDVLLQTKEAANIQDPDVGLRLTTEGTGKVTLVADRAKAGDEVVTHRESTVLVVDPEVSAFVVAGRTLDCRQTDAGLLQLVLRSPGPTDEDGAPAQG
jgi:ABC-type tungstate transport system permease subunit